MERAGDSGRLRMVARSIRAWIVPHGGNTSGNSRANDIGFFGVGSAASLARAPVEPATSRAVAPAFSPGNVPDFAIACALLWSTIARMAPADRAKPRILAGYSGDRSTSAGMLFNQTRSGGMANLRMAGPAARCGVRGPISTDGHSGGQPMYCQPLGRGGKRGAFCRSDDGRWQS